MAQRILVVDDEPHMRKVVELKLKSAGFHVSCFGSPDEALIHAPAIEADLVITDLRMPGGKSGLDLIRALRGSAGYAETPIILLTGSVAVIHSLEHELADISDVILLSKPFSPRQLLQHVQDLLAQAIPPEGWE